MRVGRALEIFGEGEKYLAEIPGYTQTNESQGNFESTDLGRSTEQPVQRSVSQPSPSAVSYTHLTLPTKA